MLSDLHSQCARHRTRLRNLPLALPLSQERCPKTVALREIKMLGTILLIILVLVLLGALPTWPYSSGWGYYPSGGVGLILIIVIILLLMGRL